MAWCRQARSHQICQRWLRSTSVTWYLYHAIWLMWVGSAWWLLAAWRLFCTWTSVTIDCNHDLARSSYVRSTKNYGIFNIAKLNTFAVNYTIHLLCLHIGEWNSKYLLLFYIYIKSKYARRVVFLEYKDVEISWWILKQSVWLTFLAT